MRFKKSLDSVDLAVIFYKGLRWMSRKSAVSESDLIAFRRLEAEFDLRMLGLRKDQREWVNEAARMIVTGEEASNGNPYVKKIVCRL